MSKPLVLLVFAAAWTIASCTADTSLPGADGGAVCRYDGVSRAVGASFPSIDGCNTCSCTSDGNVACTERACLPEVPADARSPLSLDAGPCRIKAALEFGNIGGNATWRGRSALLGGLKFRYERVYFRGAPPIAPFCTPDIPTCGTKGAVTPTEIELAFSAREVINALLATTPPLFGRDDRPVDGTLFEVKRGDGRGFLVGGDCRPGDTGCVPIPEGIALLRQTLQDLEVQQLKLLDCKDAIPQH